jgi:predicted RNA-binding protein with PUA-like domain
MPRLTHMATLARNDGPPAAAPGHWLMKSEPEEFSIDDLARRGSEPWSGVRNYQARNFMRDAMKVGDRILFYHSSCAEPGVVGLARVASVPRPDPTQFDPASEYHDPKSTHTTPRWVLVDVAFERRLRRTVSLADIRTHALALDGLALLNTGNRLSVMPVAPHHFALITALENT